MSYRHIDTLVIHCTDTPNGRWTSVIDVDHWHAQRGFKRKPPPGEAQKFNPGLPSVGYHWLVYTNGGLATGRHQVEVGAHARGLNDRSLALCLVGTDQFTPLQWTQLRQQTEWLCNKYHLPRELACADNHWRGICGHRDINPAKACPGFDVGAWLADGMQPRAENILIERRTR